MSPDVTLDQALQAVSNDEATYNADTAAVTNIETAVQTATAPLAAAQAKVATDIQQWIADLQTADQLIQAKISSLQALVPPAPPAPPAPASGN